MAATSPTESRCPACSTPGALPGERCSGCRHLIEADACTIQSWRGHQSSVFMARRADGTIVATSPSFLWSNEGNEGPRAAFEELVRELQAAGWQPSPHSPDDVWYERGFARLMALPGENLPPSLPANGGEPEAPDPLLAVERPTRRRGPRLVTAVSLIGLLVAGGLLYALLTQDSHKTVRAPKAPVTAAVVPASTPQPAVAAAPVHVAKPLTAVAVVATRDSWLELRRDGATGPILYSGVLLAGHDLHARARRVWARFGAAANLQITVNGRRVPLQGTLEKTFSR
jgi:hypothetical protein